jgi:hypothetical protein
MTLKINYSGFYKADRRDKKLRKRRKLDMTEDGRSVRLLAKIVNQKANDNLERVPTDM